MPYINKKPRKERTKHSKRSNKSSRYYNDIRWKRLRNWYIEQNPLCEVCLEQGISTPAEEIHHKREILSGQSDEERFELLLDIDNLQALCKSHHIEEHNRRRAAAKKDNQDKQSLYHVVGK